MKIKWFYLAGVGLGLVFVVLLLAITVPRMAVKQVKQALIETPVPQYLEGLQSKMFDPALDAQGRRSLAEKIEMYKLSETQQAEGLAAPAAKDPFLEKGPEMSFQSGAGLLPAGIFEGSDGMVRPEEGKILNYLQRQGEDGSSLVVFAGSNPLNEKEGLLILVSLNPAREVLEYQQYLHDAKVGALRILTDEGTRIKIQAADESMWYFDLGTRMFTQD